MEQKIRIGAVNYLNTKPMIYGLEKWEAIELTTDYPANIASKLMDNEIDIGLVPVAIIPELKESYIITEYGIAAVGKVTTVCLYSEVPIENIKTILLDYQSKTSVALLKILLQEYWNLNIDLENGNVGFELKIKDDIAGLVIGDRAFELNPKYRYVYDLCEMWYNYTQLPFVFAAWVANKIIDDKFINNFNNKVETSVDLFFKSTTFVNLNNIKQQYLKSNIKYQLDNKSKLGLETFINKIKIINN